MTRRERGSSRPLLVVLVVLTGAFFTRTFLLDAAIVDGRSMLPTLHSGEVVLVFKAAYGIRNPGGGYLVRWGAPKDGDIVAALQPSSSTVLVKRVSDELGEAYAETAKPADSIFLLGDNAAESEDSRAFGAVPVGNVLGRVIVLR